MTKIKVPVAVSVTYSGDFEIEVDKNFDFSNLETEALKQIPLPLDRRAKKKAWHNDEAEAYFSPKVVLKKDFILNPNSITVDKIQKAIVRNGGECICHNTSRDKHCPCSNYIKNDECVCGLYLKVDYNG